MSWSPLLVQLLLHEDEFTQQRYRIFRLHPAQCFHDPQGKCYADHTPANQFNE